ncbi:MAG: hypothetical protein K2K53_02490 [Oscillospiraceae bacterium]|nr:hypothetical protein [Oscillospiraceae bacterium]
MVSGIGGAYPAALGGRIPTQDGQKHGGEELTTITTHCDKDHWHTPSCPHTTYTRPVDEAQRRGEYIDLYA